MQKKTSKSVTPRASVQGLLTAGLCMAALSSAATAQITESRASFTSPATSQTPHDGSGSDTLVHLRVSEPASPHVIPSTLFGSFLEPIGHSTYGGLWADVVENPSFEDGLWSAGNIAEMLHDRPTLQRASQLGLPLPWEPLDSKQGNRYLVVRGDAGNSYQSLLVMSLPGKEIGISQRVYLPVARELTYNGTVMVKHVRGGTAIRVSLRRHAHPEQVLAETSLEAASTSWKTYTYKLALKSNQVARLEPVDLVLSISNDARAQFDNASLFPADAVDGMEPEVIDMARDLSPVVRFGGNFTSAYRWQDGVGPADKRISTINPSWGIPEYNTFGTDEFLRFCELIHAKPQIALNLGTGTQDEAASWVRYVNTHFSDKKGGLLWELGNELWGDFQIGYPSQERVGAVTLATSNAVRKLDPHAQLIATGGDEDHFHDWNAEQLRNPPGSFDYLSTHFVVGDGVQQQNPTDQFRTMSSLALPWGLAERMHAIQQQAAEAGHPKVKVAFTEWLLISDTRTGPSFTNLGGAMFAGGFLNMAMRNSDVVSISDMTGILEFGGIWKKRAQVYGAPAYWVLHEFSQAHPQRLLDLANDTPTYSVARGNNRLPEIKDVPYLDCVAAEPEDRSKLILTCVNLSLARPMQAELDLGALAASGGPVTATTISGSNILQENDEVRPRRIVPMRETQAMEGKMLHHTFPNSSVTVIQIPLAK